MAVRVMTYMGACYQDFIAHAGVPQGTGLPVIFPVVIYNGRGKWNSGCEVEGAMQLSPPGLEAYRPALRFKLLDVWRCGKARTEGNLAEAIFRIERSLTLDGAGQVVDELLERFAEGGYEKVDRSFAEWLTAVLRNRFPNRRIPTCTSLKEVRMQAIDELIPWGEQQIKHEARERAAEMAPKLAAKLAPEMAAKLAPEMAAKLAAEALQKVFPLLRRSLADRARDRFGERIARLLSAEIELLEDPAAFDRIWGWLETCESGDSLLALVQTG